MKNCRRGCLEDGQPPKGLLRGAVEKWRGSRAEGWSIHARASLKTRVGEFLCFFQTLFQRSFLEAPSANLTPKIRFLTDVGSQLDPKMPPCGTIFDQKGAKRVTRQMARSDTEPTWNRPGRDLAPKTLQGRIFIDVGVVFNRFW